jgi:hypothetical protein
MNKEYIKKLQEAIEEIGKVLGDFHNRIKVLEQPKPQKKRKIVFDWLITSIGEKYHAHLDPNSFEVIEELSEIGDKSFLFKATLSHKNDPNPYIYIGHYE